MSSMLSKAQKFARKADVMGFVEENPLMAVGLGLAAVMMGVSRFGKVKEAVKPAGKAVKAVKA